MQAEGKISLSRALNAITLLLLPEPAHSEVIQVFLHDIALYPASTASNESGCCYRVSLLQVSLCPFPPLLWKTKAVTLKIPACPFHMEDTNQEMQEWHCQLVVILSRLSFIRFCQCDAWSTFLCKTPCTSIAALHAHGYSETQSSGNPHLLGSFNLLFHPLTMRFLLAAEFFCFGTAAIGRYHCLFRGITTFSGYNFQGYPLRSRLHLTSNW